MITVNFKNGSKQHYTNLVQLCTILSDPDIADEFDGAHFVGVEKGYVINTHDQNELITRLEQAGAVKKIREKISENAGDSDSLLGTTADGVQLLLYAFSQLTVALNSASTLAEVRAASAPHIDMANRFLTKCESGEVKLTFMAKGVDNVVSDIEQRATAVSKVLSA
ncbi:MAG: hypothetical protein HRU06_14775 [Oceanospirillaceae bacterium]|nr:hypothetical protein [Oceanospirillaceae bacterium]